MSKQKSEKIWVVSYFRVRRHSRVLYLPLDPEVVRIHGIEKGDVVKAMLTQIIKGPRDEEQEGKE